MIFSLYAGQIFAPWRGLAVSYYYRVRLLSSNSSVIESNHSRKEKMSLGLTLPTASAVDWKPISLRVDRQNILRTPLAQQSAASRTKVLRLDLTAQTNPTVKIAAEVLTLACVTIGLFSLFLGLSVIYR